MRNLFLQPAGLTRGMNAVKFCGLAFGLLHLALLLRPSAPEPVPLQTALAVTLYLLSLALFWWAYNATRFTPLSAVFSPDAPRHLVIAGPYRFVRHPFYVSYLLTWTAGVVATANPWLLLTLLTMAIIYIRAARLEEQKFAASDLAQSYERYRATTGMFFPQLSLLRRTP